MGFKINKIDKWMFFLFLAIVFLVVYYIVFRDNKVHIPDFLSEDDIRYLLGLQKKEKKAKKKHEHECRRILSKIYKKPFPSVRPNFLKNPQTKKNLELDCYNPKICALEYQGQQHYHYTPYFHRSEKDFISQQERDNFKRQRCKELGIPLIEVPYTVKFIDLEKYIRKELRKINKL